KNGGKLMLLCREIPAKAWQHVTRFLPYEETTKLYKVDNTIFSWERFMPLERLLHIFSKHDWTIPQTWSHIVKTHGKNYESLDCTILQSTICDKAVRLVRRKFPNLTSLTVTTLKGFGFFACMKIRHLTMRGEAFQDKYIPYLATLPLESVDLSSTSITDRGLDAFQRLQTKTVERLRIEDNKLVGLDEDEFLEGWNILQFVDSVTDIPENTPPREIVKQCAQLFVNKKISS